MMPAPVPRCTRTRIESSQSLARTKVVLCQGQRADVVPHETGHFKAFFQRIYQPPVLNLYMGHITDHAAFGVYQAWQDHRDRNQFTDFALTVLDKVFNGIQQRVSSVS